MRGNKPSRLANRDPRWPALRLQALRRDGWQCVKCGRRTRLEVDHVQPVATHPELAFELGNLQVLCAWCHSDKTADECGFRRPSPEQVRWKRLLHNM